MRMSSIISEALRNLLSGTTRAGLLALAAGLAALALAVVDIATVAALQRQADTFHRSGASVQVLLAEGMVDPVSCDRLGQVPGVHGAGALRQRASITLSAVERNPIPAFDVTPGLRRLLAIPDAAGTGVWVSRDLAHTLGVSPSSSLATASGLMAIAGSMTGPRTVVTRGWASRSSCPPSRQTPSTSAGPTCGPAIPNWTMCCAPQLPPAAAPNRSRKAC